MIDPVIALLQDIDLPADPADRYAAVLAAKRRRDGRRYTLAGAALAVVAITGGSVLVARETVHRPDLVTVLSSTVQAGTAHVTAITLRGGDVIDHGEGEVDFTAGSAHVSTSGGGHNQELISIGTDLWLKDEAKKSGKPWVHVAHDQAEEISLLNPAKLIAGLREVDARLREAGSQTIDGVRTTHFVVTLPTSTRFDSAFGSGVGDLYVDDNELVRRISSQESGSDETQVLTFTHFGEPVSIHAPPASEVQEGSSPSTTGDDGVISLTPGGAVTFPPSICTSLKANIASSTGGQKSVLQQIYANGCAKK